MVGRDVICDRRSFPTRTLQTVTQEFLEGGHLALDDGRTGGGRRAAGRLFGDDSYGASAKTVADLTYRTYVALPTYATEESVDRPALYGDDSYSAAVESIADK